MFGGKVQLVDKAEKKELKTLKNRILKAIGDFDTNIFFAEIGGIAGATEPEDKIAEEKSREKVIQELQEAKASLRSCCEQYEQLIDKAIQKIS